MANQPRIYAVTDRSGATRLVEATHQATAVRHVALDSFSVKVPTQFELVDLVRKGVEVEKVKAEQQELGA